MENDSGQRLPLWGNPRFAGTCREEALKNFPAFGLTGYENSYPSALSGGMRQRAAFLRTALCQADILLLDEPFGALDVITRSEMQDWLLAMRARLNRTVLLVTHDMDEAIYLSDRILILNPAPAGIVSEIRIVKRNGIGTGCMSRASCGRPFLRKLKVLIKHFI